MKPTFEDSLEQVLEVISDSAAIAIAENKALGLSITYEKDQQIIEEFPDGKTRVVRVLSSIEQPIIIEEGTILTVKPRG